MIRQIAPFGFVFLWSTGWIVARYVVDFANPLLFLLLRSAFAGLILAAFALGARAAWPKTQAARLHALFSGVLLHFGYLGGVWWSIEHGVPASLSALIAALQPILTAVLAPILLRERFGTPQALGVALGFGGLLLVLAPRLLALTGADNAVAGLPLLVNGLAMVSVTAATFYQKRFIPAGDLRSVAALQYLGACLAFLPVVLLSGDLHFQPSWFAAAVMAWSVLAISVGAVALLLLLIRQGEVSRASQLLFLVPPVGAIQAMLLFGDRLTPLQWLGMAVTAAGVALAIRRA